MSNLIEDLSELSTIPQSSLNSLFDKIRLCISYQASDLIKEDVVGVDIGIGTLYISKNGDELHYKFIPTSALDESVRRSINGNVDLVRKCEDLLVDRIVNVYKDLI